eukprot:4277896-Prymnesium_polylepis.1
MGSADLLPHRSRPTDSASKFGLVGFTRAARYECKLKKLPVSCSAINPGFVMREGMAIDMKNQADAQRLWDHTIMVFGQSEHEDTAKAVIAAVNYDEVLCFFSARRHRREGRTPCNSPVSPCEAVRVRSPHARSQPELYVNFPPAKPNVIIGDIFPRMGDFLAKDTFVMTPCHQLLGIIADKQSGN